MAKTVIDLLEEITAKRKQDEDMLGENGKEILRETYYPLGITNSNSPLRTEDLNILALAFEHASGVKLIQDPRTEEANSLFTVSRARNAYAAMGEDEAKILVEKNAKFKTLITSLLDRNPSQKALLIYSQGLDAEGQGHFLNMNFERHNNEITITVADTLLHGFNDREKNLYKDRIEKLMSRLLNQFKVKVQLRVPDYQYDQDCGIHTVVNRFNYEHQIKLSAKNLVKSLRTALENFYNDSNVEKLLKAVKNTIPELKVPLEAKVIGEHKVVREAIAGAGAGAAGAKPAPKSESSQPKAAGAGGQHYTPIERPKAAASSQPQPKAGSQPGPSSQPKTAASQPKIAAAQPKAAGQSAAIAKPVLHSAGAGSAGSAASGVGDAKALKESLQRRHGELTEKCTTLTTKGFLKSYPRFGKTLLSHFHLKAHKAAQDLNEGEMNKLELQIDQLSKFIPDGKDDATKAQQLVDFAEKQCGAKFGPLVKIQLRP